MEISQRETYKIIFFPKISKKLYKIAMRNERPEFQYFFTKKSVKTL